MTEHRDSTMESSGRYSSAEGRGESGETGKRLGGVAERVGELIEWGKTGGGWEG